MRRESLSGATIVAGVVGNPARRSLSPLIHNAWIGAAGLDAAYLSFSLDRSRFTAFADSLRGGSVRGLNVTVPFKEEAFSLTDRATPFCKAAGAANLLIFEDDGTISADNTDGEGMLAAIEEAGGRVKVGPAVVLGAGGAAKAAVAALVNAGAPKVAVVNRTRSRAAEISTRHGGHVTAHDWSELESLLPAATLLVNATLLGMDGAKPLNLPLERLRDGATVMDMVYRPLLTPLLSGAQARGMKVADGLAMLIGQAAPSFTKLFGAEPDPSVDVRALALAQLEAWG